MLGSAWWTWPAVTIGIGVIVGVGVATSVGILILTAQRRRDRAAMRFQDRLTEPIARELGGAQVSVLPTVRIPVWRGATRPVVIQLTGQVPSLDLRDRVVQLVEREAGRLRYFRIEDRIRVAPDAHSRGRRTA